MRESYDVGLIIPLREEFDAARGILEFGSPIQEHGFFLHPFSIPGSSLRGVATVLFGMGQAKSAVAATRLLASVDLRLLALVGIAGSLSPGLILGDVVIASSVDEYMHGAKASPELAGEGVEFEAGGIAWQASPAIVSHASNFRYLPDEGSGFATWREQARQRRGLALAAGVPELASDSPDYHVGAIATGDIVSAAASFARWLRHHNRFRVAIEMEAGGAAHAVYQDGRTDLIVVRGISDFADERKTELDGTSASGASTGAWRRYATENAVALLSALIASPSFPWPRARQGASSPEASSSSSTVTLQGWAYGNSQVNQAARDLHVYGGGLPDD